ncbi:MAG: MotA/TolQ/ExbB proton channel family protein [Oleispira sp.]|nr:MotA/TolQ/ExbB proton channel family protein [Oleispira sp.]
MNIKKHTPTTFIVAFALSIFTIISVHANEAVNEPVKTLEGLLQQVEQFHQQESAINKQREAEFKNNKQQQTNLLNKAKAELKAEQKIASKLKASFDKNEKRLVEKEDELRLRIGNLGEMFGVVRQVADDLAGTLLTSLTRAEKPVRSADLGKLAQAKELPNIQELQLLWLTLQEEMTLTGQISQFKALVVQNDGSEKEQLVTRIGAFSAFTKEGYLRFDEQTGRLISMARQPAQESLIDDYLAGSEGEVNAISIDPTRGALLGLVLSNPDLIGRIKQGALVGYIIIVLAIIGLLLAAWRLVTLFSIRKKVEVQIKQLDHPKDDNPLGRILATATSDIVDQETLELKIDEAILKEVPQLEKAQSMIKLFAAIAPLLGLLGTVTGMIATFQAITNFGTGDPKLMAGGISQALITTVLGLVAAIPLLLSHNLVSSQSKRLIQILDEQAAGLIVTAMEERKAKSSLSNSSKTPAKKEY